ncbi:MAG: sodium transporter [Phycisphaerae bacterium]
MPSANALSFLDLAIIVVSLGLTVFVGLWASRRHERTASGYFLASNRLKWWLIGPSIVATSVSSEQIVGTIGAAYQHGMGIANWEWWTLPTYTLVMAFFIPMYLRNRVVTVPEYFSRRFGPLCADLYSWVMLAAYVVVFLVPVLYGGSLTFAHLTGTSFQLVLWLSVALVAVYTIRGGLESVMWTNLLQTILLVGGGLVLYFIVLAKVPGGWSAMVAANPQRFHLYRPPGDRIAPFPALMCLSVGLGLFYQGTSQIMIQRILGARSVWDGIMGTIFAGFINFIRPLVTCFLGFVVYHWIHELHRAEPFPPGQADRAFPFALAHMAPAWGIRGVVLAGFLAAVLSTVSSLVNSTAALFSLDVYKKLIHPAADERSTVRVGQIASLGALVLAALLAPAVERFGGIFQYFQTLVTYTATPFISVMLVGLFWRRANYPGGLVGLIGGAVIQAVVVASAYVFLRDPAPGGGLRIHWLYLGFIAQVLTMFLVVAVSLATPPPRPERYETMIWRPAWLAEYASAPLPWYKQLWLWYAVYAAIWFYLYWRFW